MRRIVPRLISVLRLGLAAVLAGVPVSASHGQTDAAPRDLPGGSPRQEPIPDTPVPGSVPSQPREGESLSEQLSRSGGVINPPANPDPDMAKPPPDTGSTTPVIPPPGSPGGDPSIQPK